MLVGSPLSFSFKHRAKRVVTYRRASTGLRTRQPPQYPPRHRPPITLPRRPPFPIFPNSNTKPTGGFWSLPQAAKMPNSSLQTTSIPPMTAGRTSFRFGILTAATISTHISLIYGRLWVCLVPIQAMPSIFPAHFMMTGMWLRSIKGGRFYESRKRIKYQI